MNKNVIFLNSKSNSLSILFEELVRKQMIQNENV